MKVFFFERIDRASSNYHQEGGLVIIAINKKEAIKMIAATRGEIKVLEKEWKEVESYILQDNPKAKIWVMPDSGCC